MTNQVNIGIIGTSWWADIMFLPALQNHERANLRAICGRNRERADEMAEKYDIPDVYTDYNQMIEQSDIDAVIVSTPDDTHYEMVMAALNAGKHVLCEKPVANNADHAREMAEKAASTGVKHMVMYTWYWMPNIQRVKQLLDADFAGKIYHACFNWIANYGRNSNYMWRFDADYANGSVSDLGSHMIYLALWMLGDATAVTGRLATHVQRQYEDGSPVTNPANDTAQFIVEFAGGAQAQFFISVTAHEIKPYDKPSLGLHGAMGTIKAEFIPADIMELTLLAQQADVDEITNETMPTDFQAFFTKESVGTRNFVDCILDDKPCTPNLHDGYKVQQVIDAVMESHETGCRIEIKS